MTLPIILADVQTRFTPRKVAGLQLWLAANKISGLSDGDPIASWLDLSGNEHDAEQSTGAKKPTYKTNILNGRPIVRFDGTDDRLEVTNTPALKLLDGVTLFIVCLKSDVGDWMVILAKPGLEASAEENYSLWFRNINVASFYIGDGSGFQAAASGVIPTATGTIITGWCDESDTKIYIDGDLKETNTNDVVMNADNNHLSIGADLYGDNHLNGDIAEIILYDTALLDADREKVETYLGKKWGI